MLFQAILFIKDESDREYIEKLYAEHRHVMYIAAYSLLHNVNDTQDAIAQAIINIIPKINDIKTLQCYELRAYIINTVKNIALATLTYRKRKEAMPYEDECAECAGSAATEGDGLSGIADADALARARRS